GDGAPDLVIADNELPAQRDGRIRVLLNNGNGTFAPAAIYLQPIHPRDVKLRDLNGDGYPDLLMGPNGNFAPYHFATALNRGDGTFVPGIVTPVNSCGEGSIDAFDLEGNGLLDVVLTEEETCIGGDPARIFLFRNDGTGRFTLVNIMIPPGLPFGPLAAA